MLKIGREGREAAVVVLRRMRHLCSDRSRALWALAGNMGQDRVIAVGWQLLEDEEADDRIFDQGLRRLSHKDGKK